MSVQQIVTPLTKSALFLVLTVNDDADPAQVRDAVSSLAGAGAHRRVPGAR